MRPSSYLMLDIGAVDAPARRSAGSLQLHGYPGLHTHHTQVGVMSTLQEVWYPVQGRARQGRAGITGT